MSDFVFDGVSSSLAEFMSYLFFFNFFFPTLFFQFFFCIMYMRNPDTTDNREHTSSAGCVLQPAGYNAIHACRLPTEQEATPHASDSLSALYYCCGFLFNTWYVFLLSDPAICIDRPSGLCCYDTSMLPHVLQHRYAITS